MKSLETKKDIRKRIRAARAGLSAAEQRKYSARIQKRLLEHPLYREAEEIYCYVSFGDEVCTDLILEESWKCGKKVAVPRILKQEALPSLCTADPSRSGSEPSKRYMEFFYIQSRKELKEGYYGILEPVTTKRADGKHVLIVMPGVAFDPSLNRIGYGGGFYDAYLKRHPDYRTIALFYSVQCTKQIPYEELDIRPKMILTEKEIYTC